MTWKAVARTGVALSLLLAWIARAEWNVATAGAQQPVAPRPVQAAQQPAPIGTAVIRGRIVAADSGRPLRRAQITVSAPELGRDRRTANTNADGRYEIKELPAARYTISVSRSGYLALRYGQRRPLEQARPLQVLDGQTVGNVDFSLPRMGLIAGRVVDEVGEPVANVRVCAMRSVYVEGRRQLMSAGAIASTDDAGQYRLSELVPGTYLVMATTRETWTVNSGGSRQIIGFVPTYFPGTPNAADASRVAVGIGQEVRNTDVALIPGRTARISGVAADSRGRPLAGRSVSLAQEFRSATGGTGFAGVASAQVAADGTFTFRNVPAAEYNLSASTPSPSGSAAGEEQATVPIVVNGADISDVMVTTSAGWSISGQIVTEAGTAPDLPPGRITVAAPPLTGASSRPRMGAGRVNDDWTFSVRAVVGPARLRIAVPDGWMVKAVMDGDRDITDSTIEMKSGEALSGVQVMLSDRVTTVTGQLLDARRAPLGDGTVIVFASEPHTWSEGSRFVRAVRPDQQGQYEIRGLPPGSYLAVAIDYVEEGTWNDPEYLASIRRHAQKLTLREGESRALVLVLVTP